MPPLPSAPNVVKFAVNGTCDTKTWANVLHWGYTGAAPTSADLTAFAAALLGAWATEIMPLADNQCTVTGVTAVDLSSALGAAGETLGSTDGSRGAGSTPASTCVLVSKSIGRRYRGGHPRSYLNCGVVTDMTNPFTWSTTLTGLVFSAYNAVRTALNGLVETGTTLATEVIVSYIDKLLNPVAPFRRAAPLVLPAGAITVSPLIATQRRRLGR